MASQEISFDKIAMWHVDALKDFCRKRNLKVSGKKAELVARVFACTEMDVPIEPTAVERAKDTRKSRDELLKTSEEELPDPSTLPQNSWLCESEGITSWPPIFLSSITIFLMTDHPGREVNIPERILNEYKEGKAYRLFEAGWLKEIYMHAITPESKFCFLKASSTHTMKIADTPHQTWIAAEKKSGKIASAYCTCVAGLSGSCIHVTALLFRIEAANRNGLTRVACTSKRCEWSVPQKKTEVKAMQITDMKWRATKLNREPSRVLCDVKRTLFRPVEPKQDKEEKLKRRKLLMGLKDIIPDACFMVVSDAAENKVSTSVKLSTSTSSLTSTSTPSSSKLFATIGTTTSITTSTSTVLSTFSHCSTLTSTSMLTAPPTPIDFTPECEILENTILKYAAAASSTKEFLSSITPISRPEEVHAIELATVGQANNPIWSDQRKGRITASNFYRVFTRMETIKSSMEGSVDPQNLIDHLLGCKAPHEDVRALKYGRNMETVARNKYLSYFKKSHKDASYRECGLFLYPPKPYLGASPDLLVECSCCGKGVLEIKCPYSLLNEVLTAENVPYLEKRGGQTVLKMKHCYFAQIQGQMAVTQRI